MRVLVGPLPSSSALAWIAYAREVLDDPDLVPADGNGGGSREREIVAGFRNFLDQWEKAAQRPTFLWAIDIDPDEARFMAHAFSQLVGRLARQSAVRGGSPAPTDGDEFYRSLVTSLLGAMVLEGGDLAAFAEDLRDRWPGLDDDR